MSKQIPNTEVDWGNQPYWQDFVEACKSCGLDAYGGEFGDIVLNAKMFFYFGVGAASNANKKILTDALNYINHVGANHTMRGEPHPQQWLVDNLENAIKGIKDEN